MYLIDTDILVFLKRGKYNIQDRMAQLGLSQCAISEISLAELYVGVYKGDNRRLEPILKFLEETLTIVPISASIKTYARIRAHLESEGTVLDDMDLLIAATALANGYTLVTHNTKHFARVPGLKVVDWTL
ncbi:MAG: PIN domain-containing protein, partial [Bacteroidales bacterium]|nr:PIN domain-containing protein [Bacteroidales bacterium]